MQNIIQKIVLFMFILLSSLAQASTLSNELRISLEADVLAITQSVQSFDAEKAKLNRSATRLVKDANLSFSNMEELTEAIEVEQQKMLMKLNELGETMLNNRRSTELRLKELIVEARENQDWDLSKELKVFRTEAGYFTQSIEKDWRDEIALAIEALENFWDLTTGEKGKILNQLLVADANATLLKVGKKFEEQIVKDEESYSFKLVNAPMGMNIQAKTGWVTWRPTVNQVGAYTPAVVLLSDGEEVKRQELNIFVKYRKIAILGLFVNLEGTNSKGEDGTAENPFSNIKSACEALGELKTIFVRGGNHTVVGSETSVSNCKGSENAHVVVKPWGNEQVSISFDGRAGIQIRNSSYVTVESFEVIGANSKVGYNEAIENWWIDKDIFQGTGIAIREGSDHILVQKNIVHDTTAAGIKAVGASAVTIKENIVYNCAWWTIQGTTGIGITLAKGHAKDTNNSKAYNQMIANLVFNNESRIYSRVWAKGEAHLRVDEGEAVLIQEENVDLTGGYAGRYLIYNNFLLNNGKTVVVNKAGRVDIRRNSFYMNGTTTANKEGYMAAGLRVNSSDDVTFRANAIEADEEHGLLYSVADNSAGAFSQEGAIRNNVGRGAYTRHGNNETLVKGFIRTDDAVFKNPSKDNFTIVTDVNSSAIGADMKVLRKHRIKLRKYGISLERNNYEVDNMVMTQDIINNIPAGATIDSSEYNVTNPTADGSYLLIKNLDSTHPYVVYQKKHNKPVTGVKLYLEYGEGIVVPEN